MTKVDFYTGVQDKLQTACQLSNKALQNGLRVVLHTPDQEISEKLDRLLWEYPPAAFIPHGISGTEHAEETPVIICHHREPFPHSEVLISLHDTHLPFFSRFERLIEIVSTDAEDTKRGRERFGFYRERGFEMRHFDLSQKK